MKTTLRVLTLVLALFAGIAQAASPYTLSFYTMGGWHICQSDTPQGTFWLRESGNVWYNYTNLETRDVGEMTGSQYYVVVTNVYYAGYRCQADMNTKIPCAITRKTYDPNGIIGNTSSYDNGGIYWCPLWVPESTNLHFAMARYIAPSNMVIADLGARVFGGRFHGAVYDGDMRLLTVTTTTNTVSSSTPTWTHFKLSSEIFIDRGYPYWLAIAVDEGLNDMCGVSASSIFEPIPARSGQFSGWIDPGYGDEYTYGDVKLAIYANKAKAVPPILGNNENGAEFAPIWQDTPWLQAASFTATTNLNATAIRAKINGSGGVFRCAIYQEGTNGTRSLLAETGFQSAVVPGWETFTLSTNVSIVTSNIYWLAIWSIDHSATVYYTDDGVHTSQPWDYGYWPNPLPDNEPWKDGKRICIYACDWKQPTPPPFPP